MNGYLNSNLRLLATRWPRLAERMRLLPEPPECRVFPTSSGRPSLAVRAPVEGGEILYHSGVNPVEEARRYAAAKSTDVRTADAVVLVGSGLGYPAAALRDLLRPDQSILLIEPSESVFRAALGAADLSTVLAFPRLSLHVGDRPPEIQDALTAFLNIAEPDQIALITYPPCQRLYDTLCGMIRDETGRATNRRRVEVATLTRLSFMFERNAIRNIPAIVRSPGVGGLFGRFGGVPAFVVAAGPSLNADLPHLADASRRGLVIAIGKTYRLLRDAAEEPHIVVSIDPQEASGRTLTGGDGGARALLVFDPDTHPAIPAGYAGPIASFETFIPICRWGRTWWGEKGFLVKGLTVAHAAFFLARALGCDPIVLSGVDFAFPGTQTHAEGVPRTWGDGQVANVRGGTIEVPATSGGRVRSHRTFLSFLTVLEAEIPKTPGRVINAGGAGALIRGTTHVPLVELLRELPELPALGGRIAGALTEAPASDLEGLRRGLERVRAGTDRIADACDRALRAARKLPALDPGNRLEAEEVVEIGRRLQSLRREIVAEKDVEPFLQRVLAKWTVDLKRCDREMRRIDPKDRRAVLRKECEKSELYFGGHIECVKFVKEEVAGVLKALA